MRSGAHARIRSLSCFARRRFSYALHAARPRALRGPPFSLIALPAVRPGGPAAEPAPDRRRDHPGHRHPHAGGRRDRARLHHRRLRRGARGPRRHSTCPRALALAAGVSVAPGGDNGPAGSVPEIWGLREFDAFLLVVDGVPWGGAFNPALTTPRPHQRGADRDPARRGARDVRRHLVRRASSTSSTAPPGPGPLRLASGAAATAAAARAFSAPLPGSGAFQQSITVDGEKRGFKDDRTGYRPRPRALPLDPEGGRRRLPLRPRRLDRQPGPGEPARRATGRVLSPLNPLDANYNPQRRQARREPAPLRHRLRPRPRAAAPGPPPWR